MTPNVGKDVDQLQVLHTADESGKNLPLSCKNEHVCTLCPNNSTPRYIYTGEILANVHQEMDKMMFKLIHFVKTKNGNDPNVH